jgi:hypothetical protein
MEEIPEAYESAEMKQLSAIRERIYDNAQLRGGDEERDRVYDMLNVHAVALAEKYGRAECNQYGAFHVLTGSGTSRRPKFDFEGEDSIVRYLTEFEAQFNAANPEKI